jgi:excisionase family DNA binding protein
MPLDGTPGLTLLIADPRRVADLRTEDVLPLVGHLEQLRAALWVRLLRVAPQVVHEQRGDAGEKVLTVPEVARELRFTQGYVYEAVRRGDLGAVRKGKYVRIRRSDLQTWLEGRSPKGLDRRPASPDSSRNGPPRTRPASLSAPASRVSGRRQSRAATVSEPSSVPDR